jgi:hypothetical protein
MAEVEIGNLKIINVTKTLPAGTEDDFRFSVPPGGVGLLKESTGHLRRSSPITGQANDIFTSEDVIIKSLEVVKQGASERTNLLSGNPNFKEFVGTGMLAHIFTVIETLENNEDVVIKVRNDDSVAVRVSLTLWFAIKPRERRIAGQGAPERETSNVGA